MVFQIGFITVNGKDYPVFLSADGMYRMTETGGTEKIYVSREAVKKYGEDA